MIKQKHKRPSLSGVYAPRESIQEPRKNVDPKPEVGIIHVMNGRPLTAKGKKLLESAKKNGTAKS